MAGLIVAALIVNVSPLASPIVVSPVVFKVVNVPAAAVDAPIITPSIAPSPPESSILTSVVTVKFVNVPAAAELAPIIVPSIAPPLISTVVSVEVPVAVISSI